MKIIFSPKASRRLDALEADLSKAKILKAVRKTLALMEQNLRHPSLNTHEFKGYSGPRGEKVFEAYAQQNTPGAYRIFWYYGPEKNQITVVAILPHPK